MSKKSYRVRFNFWLNLENTQEAEIADQIEELKNERQFTATIRDGIKLITDLKDGNLEELFEMFPWVKAEFLEYVREIKAPDDDEPDDDDLEKERQRIEQERQWLEAEQERMEAERQWQERHIEAERQRIEQGQSAIQQQLNRLEELLLQQGHVPVKSTSQTVGQPVNEQGRAEENNAAPVGLKGLKGQHIAMSSSPIEDDEDDMPLLEVKKHKGDGSANRRFIQSLMALQEQPPQQ